MPEENTKNIGFETPPGRINTKPVGKTYFLFIAIDHYHNELTKDAKPVRNLNNPIHDVNLLMDCLLEHYQMPTVTTTFLKDIDNRYNNTNTQIYDGTFVTCLFNETATKKNIKKWIEELILVKKIGVNDSLLIYFSGHGVYTPLNKRFYLIPANGVEDDSDTWLYLNDICDYFKTYQSDKRCRDLLIILDCCYAGSAKFGQNGNSYDAFFSRNILMSSGDDEVAMDGKKGKGSPFVNCLREALTANSAHILTITTIEGEMIRKLKLKTRGSQSLVYGFLPCDEHGKGEFEFFLKNKEKPRLDQLSASFIEHLNFQSQKGILTKDFNRKNNQFNIISTFGSSFDSQVLLSKVMFSWIFKKRLTYKGHISEKVEISTQGTNDISEILTKQLFDEPIPPAKRINALSTYIVNTLVGNSTKDNNFYHLFIWIAYGVGEADWITAMQKFCLELKASYLKEISLLETPVRNSIGKLFIMLSDERTVTEPNTFDLLIEGNKGDYNLLLTPKIEPLNANHFEDWKEEAAEIIQIKIPEIMEQNIFADGEDHTDIKDFILKVCAFCNFTEVEKTDFTHSLYDFRNQLF